MRFGEPHWLWLALIAPILAVGLVLALRQRERALAAWCDPALWPRLVGDRDRRVGWWRIALLTLGVIFLALTAARPQLGSRVLAVERKGIDLVIALDLSESMLAEDLKPNRLQRARQEVLALIDRLRGDRVGLVAFAGDAFVQCPLTLDYAAARMFLRLMDTELIPVPGTAIAEALRAAARAFDPEERKFKALVLITDGEDHEGDLEGALREAKEQGVRIYAVGIGTERGEPIPVRDASGQVRDYKRDRAGEVVMSRLDPASLRRICDETGGRYYDGSAGGLALDRLYAEISGLEEKEQKGGVVTLYEDRYGYFAAAALLLLSVEFLLADRRRSRGKRAPREHPRSSVKGAAVDRPSPSSVRRGPKGAPVTLVLVAAGLGLGWSALAVTPAVAADSGGRAYREGKFAEARDAWEAWLRAHPGDARGEYNLGTALHRTGELAPSEQALLRAAQADDAHLAASAFHNLGNTRARAGDLDGAATAYEEALRLTPQDRDTKHNLELVRALRQQAKSDSSQSQQEKQDQKKQDQQNQKDKSQPPKEDRPENQDQPSQDQEQDSKEQEQHSPGESEEKKPPEAKPESPNGEDDSDPTNAIEAPAEPLKISPEQARQLLDGLSQREMELQKERLKARSRKLRVEKDW